MRSAEVDAAIALMATNQQQAVARVEELLPSLASEAEQLRLLTQVGPAYFRIGRLQEGMTRAEQALQLARKLKDMAGESRANRFRILGLHGSGRWAEALPAAEAQLQFVRTHELKEQIAEALVLLGTVYRRLGMTDDALATAEQARRTAHETADRNSEAAASNLIGIIMLMVKSQPQDAIVHFARAEELYVEIGDASTAATMTGNIGIACTDLGKFSEAADYLDRALAFKRRSGEDLAAANLLTNLANNSIHARAPERALRYADEAIALQVNRGLTARLPPALLMRGDANAALKNVAAAEQDYHRALEQAEKMKEAQYLHDAHAKLADLYEKSGRFELALEHYRAAAMIDKDRIGEKIQTDLANWEKTFKAEKRERELTELRLKTVAQQSEIERTESRKRFAWLMSLGAILACVVLLGGLVYEKRRGRTLAALNARIETQRRILQDEMATRQRAQAELDRTHAELLEASHRAGRAEVAENVLHNVGNILNSVKVSAGVARQRLRDLRLSSVHRIGELLIANRERLGPFFAEDPKGSRLLRYIPEMGSTLEAERTQILSEVERLNHSVEHIAEVIRAQQEHTRAGAVMVTARLADVAEQAIDMAADVLAALNLKVLRSFEDLPLQWIDRHAVLQILVNLIRNAVEAIKAAELSSPGQIEIRIAGGAERPVAITVSDNGVGIAEADIERIFHHGFTTGRDGHGFGLHSSALAAKKMDAVLTAVSRGHHQGASFRLELPLVAQPAIPGPT